MPKDSSCTKTVLHLAVTGSCLVLRFVHPRLAPSAHGTLFVDDPLSAAY